MISLDSSTSAKVTAVAIGVTMAASMFSLAPMAHAAGLTPAQVQAILSLLSSFGADAATIANVNVSLTGGTPSAPPITSSIPSAASPGCAFMKDLMVGSSGADVTCLQNILKARGYMTANPGGYFGPATQAAVMAWQKSKGIVPATGYFGAKSRALFSGSVSTGSPSAIVVPKNTIILSAVPNQNMNFLASTTIVAAPVILGSISQSNVTLDFSTAKVVNAANPSRLHSIIRFPEMGLKVRGSEIDQDIKISTLTLDQSMDNASYANVNVLSIGRYTRSDSYDGVVNPFCEPNFCNYSYGGISNSQGNFIINLEFENASNKTMTFIPESLRLSSGGKVYKQWSIDFMVLAPYEKKYTTLQVFLPLDVNTFVLEQVS